MIYVSPPYFPTNGLQFSADNYLALYKQSLLVTFVPYRGRRPPLKSVCPNLNGTRTGVKKVDCSTLILYHLSLLFSYFQAPPKFSSPTVWPETRRRPDVPSICVPVLLDVEKTLLRPWSVKQQHSCEIAGESAEFGKWVKWVSVPLGLRVANSK